MMAEGMRIVLAPLYGIVALKHETKRPYYYCTNFYFLHRIILIEISSWDDPREIYGNISVQLESSNMAEKVLI